MSQLDKTQKWCAETLHTMLKICFNVSNVIGINSFHLFNKSIKSFWSDLTNSKQYCVLFSGSK